MERVKGEIFVVTGGGQGHLHPCIELCTRLTARKFNTMLVIPDQGIETPFEPPWSIPATLPQSFIQNPLTSFLYITPSSPLPYDIDQFRLEAISQLMIRITEHITSDSTPPIICAIIDIQMEWTKDIFATCNIPIVTFVSFGACAASMMSHVMELKAAAEKFETGEQEKTIEGLPAEISLTSEDYRRFDREVFAGLTPPEDPDFDLTSFSEPPEPGNLPRWFVAISGTIGIMYNTWEELEKPFLDYIAAEVKIYMPEWNVPIWDVGPLLPETYWESANDSSLIRGRQSQRLSNHSEDEVLAWLDSKAQDEVLYIAFGSDVGPDMLEYFHIAKALEKSCISFIWVIPPLAGVPKESREPGGFYPEDLALKVGKRGLVIYGWAPQLLILSHVSTGGFLSHCGWNSTAEAIGRGVPFLTWPIRGDQFYNSKLIVDYLKIGYKVAENMEDGAGEEHIKIGIEKLMGDAEIRERAREWRGKFRNGFPASSDWSLNSFTRFVMERSVW
ncbi:uncharacterized protein EAE97_002643 [Botrytis byssoidea]|uniref:Uncharacterized protein n=1 Tax=Botrytis byssoidea TaxID=139641 RepID=A0A9P5LXU9_9HELO|nr:uncharacterized protein EAE97_002643 [Botrytis byssoidea]KAF7951092.1 hypothetical protein EAE97_002643 [Botrytis byssoidea]